MNCLPPKAQTDDAVLLKFSQFWHGSLAAEFVIAGAGRVSHHRPSGLQIHMFVQADWIPKALDLRRRLGPVPTQRSIDHRRILRRWQCL